MHVMCLLAIEEAYKLVKCNDVALILSHFNTVGALAETKKISTIACKHEFCFHKNIENITPTPTTFILGNLSKAYNLHFLL